MTAPAVPGEAEAAAAVALLNKQVEHIAFTVHEALRAYATTCGHTVPSWQDAPDRQEPTRAAVRVILLDEKVKTPADLYELRRDDGVMPPFAELSVSDKVKHQLFLAVVTAFIVE